MSTDRSTTPAVDLARYDVVLVNSSAGKDSQAMLDYLVELADRQGVERARLVVVHADLGRVEWKGTRELAERQAAHYGLRFVTVAKDVDLLDQVERRGMWPDSKNRYCTSDQKRDQVLKLITSLAAECRLARQVRILNCLGIRAQESTARAQKAPFQGASRGTSARKLVDQWYPIFTWSTVDVWARIQRSGVEHHEAYDKGMSRLSCVFCVFASQGDLATAAKHNPELLATYCDVEARIGHSFTHKLSIRSLRQLASTSPAPAVHPFTVHTTTERTPCQD